MIIKTYLQKQLANINTLLHGIVGNITEAEWLSRPAPGQNMLGYTVWHIPRTQDTHVQTWIRGLPEIVAHERWALWQFVPRLGNGMGVSLADADEIARSTRLQDVLEYADEVHKEISSWLETISEADLDQTPDYRQHLAPYPPYQTPGFKHDTDDLLKQPVWGQLMRPCIGHIHRHLGEVEITKTILRAKA